MTSRRSLQNYGATDCADGRRESVVEAHALPVRTEEPSLNRWRVGEVSGASGVTAVRRRRDRAVAQETGARVETGRSGDRERLPADGDVRERVAHRARAVRDGARYLVGRADERRTGDGG